MIEEDQALNPAQRVSVDGQMAHLTWHAHQPHHWHVGVTALDGASRKTETITTLMGLPVYRLLDLPRESIVLVPSQTSSCHWPQGRP